MSQLFLSGGQSIRASASVLPMNIQSWFPLGWTGLIPLLFKGTLQHHNSKAPILWLSPFLMVQLSHPYMSTGKIIALTIWTFVSKAMSLLLNTLFRFVIAFLPRSKLLLIFFSRGSSRPRDQTQVSHIAGGHFTIWATREAAVTMHSDFGTQGDKICHCST